MKPYSVLIQGWIVDKLEVLCERTHFITLHRPWLWVFRNCPFARLSGWLDERWQTGKWTKEGS